MLVYSRMLVCDGLWGVALCAELFVPVCDFSGCWYVMVCGGKARSVPICIVPNVPQIGFGVVYF